MAVCVCVAIQTVCVCVRGCAQRDISYKGIDRIQDPNIL